MDPACIVVGGNHFHNLTAGDETEATGGLHHSFVMRRAHCTHHNCVTHLHDMYVTSVSRHLFWRSTQCSKIIQQFIA